jgi:hypothetical protein
VNWDFTYPHGHESESCPVAVNVGVSEDKTVPEAGAIESTCGATFAASVSDRYGEHPESSSEPNSIHEPEFVSAPVRPNPSYDEPLPVAHELNGPVSRLVYVQLPANDPALVEHDEAEDSLPVQIPMSLLDTMLGAVYLPVDSFHVIASVGDHDPESGYTL